MTFPGAWEDGSVPKCPGLLVTTVRDLKTEGSWWGAAGCIVCWNTLTNQPL